MKDLLIQQHQQAACATVSDTCMCRVGLLRGCCSAVPHSSTPRHRQYAAVLQVLRNHERQGLQEI